MRLARFVLVQVVATLFLLSVVLVPKPAHGSSWSPWQWYRVTGYDLYGTTASGYPAGPGVVAIDPRQIPMGAVVQVKGLGVYRARDTGGAIKGAHLDIWEPTVADCYRITGYYLARWRSA